MNDFKIGDQVYYAMLHHGNFVIKKVYIHTIREETIGCLWFKKRKFLANLYSKIILGVHHLHSCEKIDVSINSLYRTKDECIDRMIAHLESLR